MNNMVFSGSLTSTGLAGNVVPEAESMRDACFVHREAAYKEKKPCERGGQSNSKTRRRNQRTMETRRNKSNASR